MSALSESAIPPSDTWGPWQTGGWALVVAALFSLTQVMSVWGFVWAASWLAPDLLPDDAPAGLHTSGLLLATATLATAPVCLAAIAWIVRRRTRAVWNYLAWRPLPPPVECLRWLGYGAVFIILADGLSWIADRPLVPDFMRDTYVSSGWPPLYWLAVIAVAPLLEEIFFRGFLFRGLAASRLGATGAVVATSLLWSLVHTQYDPFELMIVLTGGLFLGWARVQSGSTRVTFGLHAGWNLVAVIQVAVVTAGGA